MTTASKATKPVAPLSVPALAADLDAGLRRLKLAAIRRTAPEVLITWKTQRWTPKEVLRTLVDTELAARGASNVVNRLKAAGFPVTKALDAFDIAGTSSWPLTQELGAVGRRSPSRCRRQSPPLSNSHCAHGISDA